MTIVSFPASSPCLVVFGRDHAGKPHASWFDSASAELATKAAKLMGMHAVTVEGEELRELAGTLPRGRVFSSGKAFTPFIKGKLYGRLVELTRDLLGITVEQAEAGEPATSGAAAGDGRGAETASQPHDPGPDSLPPAQGTPRPSQASEIGIGSLVLASTGGAEGWYEAEVIGANGGMLTLKWRDYNEPTVIRRPGELGFLPLLPG